MFNFSVSAKIPAGQSLEKVNSRNASQSETNFLETVGEAYKANTAAQIVNVPMSFNEEALSFLKNQSTKAGNTKFSDEELLQAKVDELVGQISALLGEEKPD